jgi:hypothetical protein
MLPCARVDGIAPTYLSAARSPGSRRNMAAIRIEYARVRFHGENGRARGPARVGAGPSTSASQDLGHHRTPKSQSAICKLLPSAAHHTSPSMRPSASERLIRLPRPWRRPCQGGPHRLHRYELGRGEGWVGGGAEAPRFAVQGERQDELPRQGPGGDGSTVRRIASMIGRQRGCQRWTDHRFLRTGWRIHSRGHYRTPTGE